MEPFFSWLQFLRSIIFLVYLCLLLIEVFFFWPGVFAPYFVSGISHWQVWRSPHDCFLNFFSFLLRQFFHYFSQRFNSLSTFRFNHVVSPLHNPTLQLFLFIVKLSYKRSLSESGAVCWSYYFLFHVPWRCHTAFICLFCGELILTFFSNSAQFCVGKFHFLFSMGTYMF